MDGDKMKRAILIEHHDGDKLTMIVCNDDNGGHIFDALWDPTEANTPENRKKFRMWVSTMLKRKGYTDE